MEISHESIPRKNVLERENSKCHVAEAGERPVGRKNTREAGVDNAERIRFEKEVIEIRGCLIM